MPTDDTEALAGFHRPLPRPSLTPLSVEEERELSRKALREQLADLDAEETDESRALAPGSVVIVRSGRRVDTASGMPAEAGSMGVVSRLVPGTDKAAIDFAVFGVHGCSWGDCPIGWVRPATADERHEGFFRVPGSIDVVSQFHGAGVTDADRTRLRVAIDAALVARSGG